MCVEYVTLRSHHSTKMFGLLQRALTHPLLRPSAALAPLTPMSSQHFMNRSMKVVSSLKKRCESCYIVKRGKIAYVFCTANPRHKSRQGPKRKQ